MILTGTLFNEIYIKRTYTDGTEANTIKVPITYGPKDKLLARLNQDAELNRPYSIILPYMSFQMGNIRYAQDRKISTTGRMPYIDNNKNYSVYVYNPVPYDIEFQLNIVVKNLEDGSKILEQILPFFTPEWTTTIKVIDDPAVIVDIPVVLNRVQSSDNWDGKIDDRRYMTWTLDFTLKGYLYGPVPKSKIIKKAISNVIFTTANTTSMDQLYANHRVDERVVVTPGLTANGQPTSDPNQTIDYSLIDWDDDFGYVVQVEQMPYSNT